nr:immunoglobulin light chain junction region [Macaca mulatta]MOX11755.1 immunoglobulin light chain junction region [Macaca mulatta]MOX11782.1 immunoglobulin light chain junction region [Macaca mulatta]MOX12016.1 immunoglobulin light chain junction region [Macaca mulatta]MOX12371.1 immunoglobulin light chain junction region [Macaca mulatta]
DYYCAIGHSSGVLF